MHALANAVGDTVFLSVRHGADSVCLGRYVGNHQIQVLSIEVGARRPLGASVSGIVLLSGLPAENAQATIHANARRLAAQDRSVGEVVAAVTKARAQGHVYAEQGVMPGTSAMAAPIRDGRGGVLAAISVAALADRLTRIRAPMVLAQLHRHATQIARRHADVERAAKRRPEVAYANPVPEVADVARYNRQVVE